MPNDATPLPHVVISHLAHQGVAYHLVEAAREAGVPVTFLTSLYYKPDSRPIRLLRGLPVYLARRAEAMLSKRHSAGIDPCDVIQLSGPWPDLARRLTGSIPIAGQIHDILAARWLRRHVPSGSGCIYHGFVGAARRSLEQAKRLGFGTVIEMTSPPIGMELEAAALRELGQKVRYTDEAARQWAELASADYVVAQSQYGVDILRARGFLAERIILLPLGVDVERFSPARRTDLSRPMRALFVGNLGVRKGLHHLLRAWRELALGSCELILVGQRGGRAAVSMLKDYRGLYKHVRPVTHARLAEIYRDADLFVFPSLSEGGALVVLEAMASGLPCIVSSGAPSVIRDGIEGFIVPVGDIEALKDRIMRLYTDPELRRRMGAAARARAEQFTWNDYRRRVAAMYRMLAMHPHPSDDVIDLSGR